MDGRKGAAGATLGGAGLAPGGGDDEDATETRPRGRARDPDIDARVLAAASRHLAAHGYEAMSLTAVADEAGTTRQALYRRWPDKANLAAAALELHAYEDRPDTGTERPGGPFDDLVAELANFQRGVSRPGRLSLVGAMLQDNTDDEVRSRYRHQVVEPRRTRIRSILDSARSQRLIDANADLEVAVTLCTGSWYGRALATDEPPPDWARRVATLVWQAVGGTTRSTV